jgi:hypothetical protein
VDGIVTRLNGGATALAAVFDLINPEFPAGERDPSGK